MSAPTRQDEATPAEPAPSPPWRRWFILATIGAVAAVVAVVLILTTGGDDDPVALDGATALGDLTDGSDIEDGDPAPDFTVDLIDGSRFSLSSHLADDGRPVFLNLWASWCLPCRNEMPAIDEAATRHPGVMFLGVAVKDDPAAAREFAEEIGVAYPIGLDTRTLVEDLYPAIGMPSSYLISSEGVILQEIIGEVNGERIDAAVSTYFGG